MRSSGRMVNSFHRVFAPDAGSVTHQSVSVPVCYSLETATRLVPIVVTRTVYRRGAVSVAVQAVLASEERTLEVRLRSVHLCFGRVRSEDLQNAELEVARVCGIEARQIP